MRQMPGAGKAPANHPVVPKRLAGLVGGNKGQVFHRQGSRLVNMEACGLQEPGDKRGLLWG